MFGKKKLIIGAVIVVAVLACAGALIGGQSIAQAETTASATPLPPIQASGAVIADGRVIPWQSVDLGFAVGGKVEAVAVKEGDQVQAGQVLARLAGSEQAEAAVAGANMELLSAKQALDTIKKNAPIAAAQAELDLARARKAEQDTKSGAHTNDAESSRVKLQDARKWLNDAEARYYYLMGKNDNSSSGQAALQQAYKEYIQALQAVQKAQAEYDTALANGATGGSLDSDISMAAYQLAIARRNAAEEEYNRLKDGPDPDAMALAEARVYSAQCQLAAAEAGLRALELHAPFSGIVVATSLKEGEFVSPGIPMLTVANLSVWKIETTDLSEIDVTKITVGDSVGITFDAIPGLELTGKVSSISGLGQNRQGEITYSVTIILDNFDERLLWNMTAMVKIQGE